jgi:hypothetical protein
MTLLEEVHGIYDREMINYSEASGEIFEKAKSDVINFIKDEASFRKNSCRYSNGDRVLFVNLRSWLMAEGFSAEIYPEPRSMISSYTPEMYISW